MMRFASNKTQDSDIVFRLKHPKIINNYWLGNTLGRGSYGVVREAAFADDCQLFAIKMINKRKTRTPYCDADVEILQEVEILERITPHPNCVFMKEWFENKEKSKVYIVLDYMNGGTLQQLMDTYERCGRKMPLGQVKKLFEEILAGLSHLHSLGVMHRDIKPGNILLSTENRIKLSDFGVAELVEEFHDNTSTKPKRLTTKGGRGQGSIAYQSPEVAASSEQSPSSPSADIWAVGVILFQLVVGRYPFPEFQSVLQSLETIASCEYEIPDSVEPTIADLIRGIMTKDPASRLTISQILSHPWMEKIYSDSDQWISPHQTETWFSFCEDRTECHHVHLPHHYEGHDSDEIDYSESQYCNESFTFPDPADGSSSCCVIC